MKKELTLKKLNENESAEDEARETLERLRWGDHVHCPRCGSDRITKVTPNKGKKIRKGLYRCKDCRKAKRTNQ